LDTLAMGMIYECLGRLWGDVGGIELVGVDLGIAASME
jgi:hypothetical protein